MTREEISKKSLKLVQNNKIVTLEFATGVGKSKVALEICSYFFKERFKILIVVAELAHFDNWKDEIIKWGFDNIINNITIVTYASLKKHINSKYDIIILDEAHHIGSDLRLDIINNIKFDKMLLLSATLDNNLKEYLKELFKVDIASNIISLQNAIDWNLLPTPKIILIPLKLDNTKEKEEIIEEWGKSKLRIEKTCRYSERWEYLKHKKTKYPNMRLKIKCTEQQKYNYISEKYEYFKRLYFKNHSQMTMNKWLQLGLQRKKFMGELKTPIVKVFLKDIKDKRFICFCSSIEQADHLGKQNAIHSKKDNSLQILDDFNNKNINNIFAVGMLQEGQNLVNIEAGIIIQLDGKERSFIQKFGRSLRAEDPVQYIFYYKNTKDVEYLEKVLEGINTQYIQYLNYEDNNR